MRRSRMVLVLGGSATLIGAGLLAAPEPVTVAAPIEPVQPAPEEPTPAEPAAPAPPPPAETPAKPASTTQSHDGPVVRNARGTFQARITVENGVVVAVEALQAGTSASESVRINQAAIPVLAERVLAAQSWDVDAVSGASFTSPAMIESIRGAFDAAGL